MKRKCIGEPARIWPLTAGGELNRVDREHKDHEIRRERSRTAQVETGLPFVVVAALIVAIIESHGVGILCQRVAKGHRNNDEG